MELENSLEGRNCAGFADQLDEQLIGPRKAAARLESTVAAADYKMIQQVLDRVVPQLAVRALAKAVIARFGSFAEAIAADPLRLAEIEGMSPVAINEFKFFEAAVQCFAKGVARERLRLNSWPEVAEYYRISMALGQRELFRVLFLDVKNGVIADEIQGVGTVNHVPVYTREVLRRALELSATAIILIHNHPSGDPTPSAGDVRMTHDIIAAAKYLGIKVHDHIIVGREGYVSLKAMKLI